MCVRFVSCIMSAQFLHSPRVVTVLVDLHLAPARRVWVVATHGDHRLMNSKKIQIILDGTFSKILLLSGTR